MLWFMLPPGSRQPGPGGRGVYPSVQQPAGEPGDGSMALIPLLWFGMLASGNTTLAGANPIADPRGVHLREHGQSGGVDGRGVPMNDAVIPNGWIVGARDRPTQPDPQLLG
ncbi:hypothetical protein LNQ03_08310 [Klebsiella pneumoniae subsp. pneumoniae]|nr:hypothetical protein [Klebsiella pneumoniae subsp. pneumoniae]